MIERVDDFKYLGSQKSSNGNQEMNVEARLQKVTTTFDCIEAFGIEEILHLKLNSEFTEHLSNQSHCTELNHRI